MHADSGDDHAAADPAHDTGCDVAGGCLLGPAHDSVEVGVRPRGELRFVHGGLLAGMVSPVTVAAMVGGGAVPRLGHGVRGVHRLWVRGVQAGDLQPRVLPRVCWVNVVARMVA